MAKAQKITTAQQTCVWVRSVGLNTLLTLVAGESWSGGRAGSHMAGHPLAAASTSVATATALAPSGENAPVTLEVPTCTAPAYCVVAGLVQP